MRGIANDHPCGVVIRSNHLLIAYSAEMMFPENSLPGVQEGIAPTTLNASHQKVT